MNYGSLASSINEKCSGISDELYTMKSSVFDGIWSGIAKDALAGNFDDAVRVSLSERPGKCNIKTMPHPGFPTDAQAPVMAALLKAEGCTAFTENIFENRYRHVPQLLKFGADIWVQGKNARIRGVEGLKCARAEATDLRGGASRCG